MSRRAAAAISLVVASLASCGQDAVPQGHQQVSGSGAVAYEAALAVLNDGFVAAWHDTRHGNAEIYMRRLAADGTPTGPERRLTTSPESSYEPSIESVDGRLAVAWYDKALDGTLVAKVALVAGDGQQLWTHSMPAGSRNPVVRSGRHGIFCAWIQAGPDGEAVWGGWWERDGAPRDGFFRIAPASDTTWNLNAAIDGGGVPWVVFDAVSGTRSSELFLARVGSEGPQLTRLSADDGVPSKYPDLAMADGRGALTWYDERDGNTEVYLAVGQASQFTAEGMAERTGRRVTSSPGESIGAYVAWGHRRIGLAWSDSDGEQLEVYFQPFDGDGSPLAAPRRLTRTAASSLIPAIRATPVGFGIAWNEYQSLVADSHDERGRSEIAFSMVQ